MEQRIKKQIANIIYYWFFRQMILLEKLYILNDCQA